MNIYITAIKCTILLGVLKANWKYTDIVTLYIYRITTDSRRHLYVNDENISLSWSPPEIYAVIVFLCPFFFKDYVQ